MRGVSEDGGRVAGESSSTPPRRIQLRRRNGWRKPPGVVVVARPSRWGNPFPIDAHHSRADVVARFERALLAGELTVTVDDVRELAGKDLACWCPLDGPCHADVLLEIAGRAPGARPSD